MVYMTVKPIVFSMRKIRRALPGQNSAPFSLRTVILQQFDYLFILAKSSRVSFKNICIKITSIIFSKSSGGIRF